MSPTGVSRLSICLLLSVLVGCGSPQRRSDTARGGGYYQDDGPGSSSPDVTRIPDAVPKDEPPHRFANRPYQVLGRTYVPMQNREPWRERGLASWYGRKYHGQKTAIGEVYDMYAMTAAHKTLPLPSYVRVTHVANGKSVVVRVNDRGPFVGDRVIDLSWTAAAKLGLLGAGSAMVEIERVFAGSPAPPAASPLGRGEIASSAPPAPASASPVSLDATGYFVQLGAFASRDNAESLRRRGQEVEIIAEHVSISEFNGLFRVRAGPWRTRTEAEAIAREVQAQFGMATVVSPR